MAGLSGMITREELSAEYRPGVLLPEEDTILDLATNVRLPRDFASSQKYLEAYQEKLHRFAARTPDPDSDEPVPATPVSTPAPTPIPPATPNPGPLTEPGALSNEALERLKKVGAKNFKPKALADRQGSPQGTFNWSFFKKEQARSIEKLATAMSDETINNKVTEKLQHDPRDRDAQTITLQQKSKFGVYEGWEWQPDKDDENKFYLVNSISNPPKKIIVNYDKEHGKIDVKTNKENMKDEKIIAIMLEIARNIQRHHNVSDDSAAPSISKFGLNDNSDFDKQITHKLNQGMKALNEGVKQARGKKQNFDFDN